MTKPTVVLAAAFLALAFGFITYVAILVEPGMGFTTIPADFLDPAKAAVGYIVLAISIVFLYAFVPVPPAFFVWAVALTMKQVGSSPGSAIPGQ